MAELDTPQASNQSLQSETDATRVARIARELAIIERAEAALEAGLGIEYDELEKWLDALDLDENTPLPKPSGRKIHFR